jgi:endonuclease/exonuclease/phosphatase family metal-dependent hydrolase
VEKEKSFMKLRIVTYNIHGAVGIDGKRDFQRIGAFLKAQQIDIALIQELNTLSSDYEAKRHVLELQTDHFGHFVAAPTITRANNWHGNGLFSCYPITQYNVIDISRNGKEPRNILEGFIQTPQGLLHVMNTHKGLGYIERSHQMAQLNELLKKQSDTPLVVGGDINEWQAYSAGLRRLNQALRPLPTGPTFPTFYPLFHLDRIWCRPENLQIKCEVLRTPETRIYSDHFPLMIELDF